MVLPPQQARVRDRSGTDLVGPRAAQETGPGYLLVARTLAPVILAVSGTVATFFFLRGHNAPGGGFVAALVMAIGLLLQYVAFGTDQVEDRVRLAPRVLIGVGLLLVLGTSAGSIAFGYPLLTSRTFHLALPLVGDVHVGTAMAFDLGVFCEVLGSALLIITSLAHQSIRAHRIKGGG
jgi:multicomponent K+:H+ antiporter subunit A